MENQSPENKENTRPEENSERGGREVDQEFVKEEEEIPDAFQCSICLDLIYKPVVLGCGHLACFWCIFKDMNHGIESQCHLCRNPYNHFPSICRLLHFLTLKLYPLAYRRRENQVGEEEKKSGYMSPQFDDYLSESYANRGFDVQNSSPSMATSLQSVAKENGEPSTMRNSLRPLASDDDCSSNVPKLPNDDTASNAAIEQGHTITATFQDGLRNGNCKKLLLSDAECVACKQLLCRPVVLNCGHVYCEGCIINPSVKSCRCPICQVAHPNGFPNVCLVLEHILQEHFPEEYATRMSSRNLSIGSMRNEGNAASSSSILNSLRSYLRGEGPKIHLGVGCDSCGIWPIVGERYRCKDCKEKMGFDLCEGCYNSKSKLPGRFNQQHRPEHQFEIEEPIRIMRWMSEPVDAEDGATDQDQEAVEEVPSAINSSDHASEEEETGRSLPNDSSGDEDADISVPNDTSEDDESPETAN